MSIKPDFETMFSPKSVAIIGASANDDRRNGGSDFISCFRDLGFAGRIYPVNPKATEISGLQAYPNIGAVPETVDLAILSVPARIVPQILVECADGGVRNIHIFTAGFKETGEQEGIELEKQIKEIAEQRGLSIIGPNCMGLYVPKAGIVTWGKASRESGPVAFLSQSGGIAGEYSNYAMGLGIRFSKVVSFGNATVLDSTDFLEYLADDPETEIINMYLEGIDDGRKLMRLVKEINRRKPVVILKGGLTESGARAVSSHTGSLAGSEAIWDAFFRQTGATRVNALEELMDVTTAFLNMLPMRGRRIALMSYGGGLSVAGADACAREGLDTPVLTEDTRRQMREYVPKAGNSIRNPLDIGLVLRDRPLLERTLNLVGSDPRIDGFLMNLSIESGRPGSKDERKRNEAYAEFLGDFARNNVYRKPLAIALRSPGHDLAVETERIDLHAALVRNKVAVMPTLPRAARALSKFAQYHEYLREQKGQV